MSPRSYDLGKRREQIDHGRQQILDAARALLAEATSYTAFTVEAVAKRADVVRATVYYQFVSKAVLLESLCDDLAETGRLSELTGAFNEPDPAEALRAFIACFGRFWDADRLVMRRLRALAALDPEVGAVIEARDRRRREALTVLVGRLVAGGPPPLATDSARTMRVLYALTSFETFDGLASTDDRLTEVTPVVVGLAELAWQRRAE